MNWANIKGSIIHTALTLIAMGVPVVIAGGYSWESLTIGGILGLVANWAKLALA